MKLLDTVLEGEYVGSGVPEALPPTFVDEEERVGALEGVVGPVTVGEAVSVGEGEVVPLRAGEEVEEAVPVLAPDALGVVLGLTVMVSVPLAAAEELKEALEVPLAVGVAVGVGRGQGEAVALALPVEVPLRLAGAEFVGEEVEETVEVEVAHREVVELAVCVGVALTVLLCDIVRVVEVVTLGVGERLGENVEEPLGENVEDPHPDGVVEALEEGQLVAPTVTTVAVALADCDVAHGSRQHRTKETTRSAMIATLIDAPAVKLSEINLPLGLGRK